MRYEFVFALLACAGCDGGWQSCHSSEPEDVPNRSGVSILSESETGPKLVWRGQPRLIVGHSSTQAWMELGDDFDAVQYLDSLNRQEIGGVLIWSYIGSHLKGRQGDFRIGYKAKPNWPWKGTVSDRNVDLTEFNQHYFDRLKEFVALAADRDMIVVVVVHDGWTKDRFASHPFNAANGNGPLNAREDYVQLATYGCESPDGESKPSKNQRFQEAFATKLLDTLSDYDNVIFEMFNEGEWYPQEERRLHERHFVSLFKRRGALTITNVDHIRGFDSQESPSPDILSIHTPRVDANLSLEELALQIVKHRRSNMPLMFTETVPALGRGDYNRTAILRVLWVSVVSGVHVFVQDDTSFRYAKRSAAKSLRSDGEWLIEQLGRASRLSKRLGLHSARSTPQVCNGGICVTTEGGLIVGLSEGSGSVDVSGASSSQVNWLDVEKGEFVPVSAEQRDAGLVFKIRKPGLGLFVVGEIDLATD